MTFRVKDGLSVNGALFVDTSTNVRAVSAVITGTTGVTSAVTGALQVAGGVGVAGGGFFGGTVTATTFVGAFAGTVSGTASSANNLTNGTAGQTPYQTGAGATSFYGPGTKGDVLVSGGTTTAPIYQNTLTLTGTTVAVNSTTGALTVAGGVGIGGSLFVGATGYVAGAEIVTTSSFSTVLGGALETVSFLPNYITNTATLVTVSGTVTSYGTWTNGGLADVSTFGDYNTATQTGYYGILDQGGVAPGYVVYIGWTSITQFNRIVFNVNYTQNSGHTVNVDLYNYDTAGWDTFAVYSGSAGWTQFALQLIDHLPYIDNSGNVTARFYHVSTGNAAHRTWIDYVALEQSTTGGQGPRGATGATGATGAQGVNTSTNASTFNFFSAVNATSTNTGAVVVEGGVGIGQDMRVGGTIYGRVTTATNVAGGTAGQLVLQSGSGATTFVGPGTAGQILVSNNSSGPVYTNTSSIYVNSAVNAEELRGGTAGQLVYQSAPNVTDYAGPGTQGQLLMSNGASAPLYTNTASIYVNSAVYAEEVRGGTAGDILYQSAANTTAYLSLSGTQKSLLTAGASAPTYVTQVQAQSGTGSATGATGQSLVVTGGGLGVTGDSYFANALGVAGGLTVGGNVTFNGGVTFSGTATTIASTNTVYTDNIINLHTPPGGVSTAWTVDDLKDVGFIFHYYAGADKNAALVLANDTKYLEWYSNGTEGTTGTIWQGTYGTFKTGSILLNDTTGATSAVTGALQIKGGVGVGGGMFVTGNVTATTFIGALTGTATQANNLNNGTAGQLVYQSGANSTAFAGPGTAGQILLSNGTSGPVYTNTASIYVNSAVNAQTLFGGTAGQLHYQSAPGVTAFAGPGTAGQILVSGGAAVPVYTNTASIYVGRAVLADSATGSAGSVVNALTAGAGLTSSGGTFNGSAAVTFSLNTATYMATAVTANNIAAGTAGQLVYQTGAGTTAFAGPGTAGQLLMSNGTNAPAYQSTLTVVGGTVNITSVTASSSTATGALQVQGGVGIGGNLNVGGTITVGTGAAVLGSTGDLTLTSTGGNVTTTNIVIISNSSGVTSAATGALRVTGGVGIGGGLYVGGTVTATTFVGAFAGTVTGTASSANNLTGGTAGQIHYQSAAGVTAFAGPGTAGQILVSAGTSAPTYTSTASIYVNSAVFAEDIRGGTAGQLLYQSAANVTDYVGAGTAGQILVSGGAAVPVYTNTASIYVGRTVLADSAVGSAGSVANALTIGSGLSGTSYNGSSAVTITLTTATLMTTAVNVAGGTAGQLHYQTGAGATAFAGPGTAGQLLMSAGTSAPVYTSTSSIYVNRAVTADNLVGGSSISGNLTVTGNLVVQGVTTTVDSTVTNIADPIITVGGGAAGAAPASNDSKDRGIAFQWHNGTTAKVGFFGYDNSTGFMTFVPDATITNEVVSGTKGTLDVTLAGSNVSGNISGNAANVTGVVAIANGGTGASTRQDAMDALAGSTTSGQYLRGNGTDVVMSAIQAADVPTLNQNTTGSAGSVANAHTAGTGLSGSTFNGSAAVTWTLNTATLMATAVSALSVSGAAVSGNISGNAANVTGVVAVANGGTGQTTYTDGQLLIGNSTGNTLAKATLTAGTAIGITNGAGSITINNSGVTSIVAGTGVSISGATGAVTVNIGQAVATSSNVQFNSLGVGTAGSAVTGEIRATNEITAYYSDRRLKENVKVIDNAVDKVLSLHGITYTPNEVAESFGYDRTVKLVGLFADEVEAVLPEATRPAPFDQDENGNSKSGENYKTIQYEKLVPLLIEAIKEQQKQIAQLSETINTLVNK